MQRSLTILNIRRLSSIFTAQCHCGNVKITTRKIPNSLLSCNCSICNRIGALWAYYKADEVVIDIKEAPTSIYLWDKREIELHYCPNCSCTTHYCSVDEDGKKRTVINARMAELKIMEEIPVKKFDGADTWKFLE